MRTISLTGTLVLAAPALASGIALGAPHAAPVAARTVAAASPAGTVIADGGNDPWD